MHLEGLASPVFGRGHAIRHRAHAIFQERAVDEARPHVERVDDLAREAAETPGLIGGDDALAVALLKPAVELDNPPHERWREDADAAVIEQVDAGRAALRLEHRVV